MSSNNPHDQAEANAVEWNMEKTEAIIRPWGFGISWGDDDRYWHMPPKGNKTEPVELVEVCWLEVGCSAEVKNGKKYEIGFKITLKENASGWKGSDFPIFMIAKVGKKGKYIPRKMKPFANIKKFPAEIPEEKFQIVVPEKGENQLFLGLCEIWGGNIKKGLQIHHAFIREVDGENV